MAVETSSETHPFFQSRAIPHRAVSLTEMGDDVDPSLQPGPSNHSIIRKRKSGPLVERPSNTHLPQLITNDSSVNAKQVTSLDDESKGETTPKKKVLKLNSNGKLLSSPLLLPALPAGLPPAKEASTTASRASSKRTRGRPSKSKSLSLIVKIGYGRDSSDERLRIGRSICDLLGPSQQVDFSKTSSTPRKKRTPKKATHPFFFGKVKPLLIATDEDARSKDKSQASDALVSPASGISKKRSPPAKPAWSDIVFSSKRNPNENNQASPAPWPPTNMQRVDDLQHDQNFHLDLTCPFHQKYKSKGRAIQFLGEEDVLRRARCAYHESLQRLHLSDARHPTRKVLSGDEMSARLKDKLLVDRIHLATQRLQTSMTTTLTAFDQGKCDQSSWTTKSAPAAAEEVLQVGPEAMVLRDWVKTLTVTSVEGAQPAEKVKVIKPQRRRRGRPKRSTGVDDFVVCSEDDADELTEIEQSTRESSPFVDDVKRSVIRAGAMTLSQDKGQIKNTILVSGPTGCGKTASVYASAKELDFEVFEINAGTRRGAKELLGKVGDMTQNHLVQQGSREDSAEETSATPIDDAAVQDEIASGKQRTMNGFFQTQTETKIAREVGQKRKAMQQDDQREESMIKKPRKTQKQSLILLEEVDVLFEDDKSFWSGVMSLINQSKRPIILTCNDESALPLDDLPLHGILRYSSTPEDVATDYLLALAASEGHELERDAVCHLYRSLKHDLRAAITELDFWCQMGVGSRKGGVDWMLDERITYTNHEGSPVRTRPRVSSTDTYLSGMSLIPYQPEMDPEQLVFDAHQHLNIPIDTWSAEARRTVGDSTTITDSSIWADLHSDLDLCHRIPFDTDLSNLQLRIVTSLTTRLSPTPPAPTSIFTAHIQPSPYPTPKLTSETLFQILDPLTRPKPTFPPTTQRRLAPSLDSSPLSTLTTDIAPYIRSIIAFEQKWGASLPVPKRNTRASRKPEGYFPDKLVAEWVLRTGGVGWEDL